MKIKSTLFLIITIFSLQKSFSQSELILAKSKNPKLIKVLNNSILVGENRENSLSVKIFTMDNGTGSAGFNNCEVSYNLLIAVSEFDEEPVQNLFEIGPFINPKFITWTKLIELEKEIKFEYGLPNNRKTIKLNINIDELIMLK